MDITDAHLLDKRHNSSDRDAVAQNAREQLSLCATKPPESRMASSARSAEGEVRLRERIESRERELEAKYPGIKIVPPGEKVGEQQREKRNGELVNTGVPIISRVPTMKELAALDAALQHSEPSYRSINGSPLRIVFGNRNPISGPDAPSAVFDKPDADHPNGPELSIFPAAAKLPPLEKDLSPAQRRDIMQAHSLEAVLNHELGHAAQYRNGGVAHESDAQYKYDAGWVPLKQPPGQDPGGWALRGNDGYLYQPVPTSGTSSAWVPIEGGNAVDNQGRPVGAGYDANGNYKGRYLDWRGRPLKTPSEVENEPTIPTNVASIDSLKMAHLAVVKPIGPYFPTPLEEVAEGMRLYRTDSHRRTQLLDSSPGLYRVAQRLDQRDLDREYGQGIKLRLPGGMIADATEANRELIRSFESRH